MINFMGILTLLVAVLIGATLFEVFPALGGDARIAVGALVLFATSLLAELVGVQPRVLFLVPLWLAALVAIGVYVHDHHGVLAVVGLVACAIALQGLMMVIGAYHERRRERRELGQRLQEIDLGGLNPAFDQAWETLSESILIPRVTPWTGELLKNNRRSAELLLAWMEGRIPEPRLLRRAVLAFAEGALEPAKVDADKLRQEAERMRSMILHRDALAKKTAALRELAAASG